MTVQYFNVSECCLLSIHFYLIQDGSIIQFMRAPHTLMSMEFYPSQHKLLLNAYMHGEPMKNPISIHLIESLKECRINYNKRRSVCSIVQNNVHTSKIKISDFDFNVIVVMSCRVNIDHQQQTTEHSCNQIEYFLDQSCHLDGFEKLADEFEKGSIHQEDLKKIIKRYKKKSIENRNKDHKEILKCIDIFSKNQMMVCDLTHSKKIHKDHQWPIYLMNCISNSKIYLHESGMINDEEKTLHGHWKAWKTSLWIAFNGKIRQFFLKKSEWIDDQQQNWLWSGNISSEAFLSRYHKSNDIIVLIITCIKKIKQAKMQQNTWVNTLQNLGIRCLFVAGDPDLEFPELSGNFLFLPCPDNYESLPKKVFYALHFIYKHYDFEHVYKVDDDAYVNCVYFMYLEKLLKNIDYMGRTKTIGPDFNRFWHRGKCSSNHLNNIPYPANRINLGTMYARGEAGYFLSKKAIKSLIPYEQFIISDLYEDKVIGDCLNKEGIIPQDNPLYKTKLYENFDQGRYLDSYGLIVDVPSSQMKRLHDHHFKNNLRH